MREQRQEEVTWISGAVEFTEYQSQDSDQVTPPAPNPMWPLGQSSLVVSSSSPTICRYISLPILSWSPWDWEIISNRLGSYENSRTSYFELAKWPHQLRHLLWLNNGLEAVHPVSCPVQYLNMGRRPSIDCLITVPYHIIKVGTQWHNANMWLES